MLDSSKVAVGIVLFFLVVVFAGLFLFKNTTPAKDTFTGLYFVGMDTAPSAISEPFDSQAKCEEWALNTRKAKNEPIHVPEDRFRCALNCRETSKDHVDCENPTGIQSYQTFGN